MIDVVKVGNRHKSSIDLHPLAKNRVRVRIISHLNHHLVFEIIVSNKVCVIYDNTFGFDECQPVVDVRH